MNLANDSTLLAERFRFTVFVSLAFHAILILGVGFSYSGAEVGIPPLEITLAQYRSKLVPEVADFLAQENQEGSGELEEAAAPTTPYDSSFNADDIHESQALATQPPVHAEQPFVGPLQESPFIEPESIAFLSSTATDLLDQLLHWQTGTKPEPRPRGATVAASPEPSLMVDENATSAEISLAIASLQAQLDRHRQTYAKRPRRYTISSASTRRSEDAAYLDAWRRRIEAVGNLNYPNAARERRIYGSLRLLVALHPDGQVHKIEILQSSGEPVLDQAAVEIVNLAAPFAPFTDELKERTDILEIIRTWRFHEGNAFTSY